MLRPTSNVEVYLYMTPVDMRKSINGLAALVENELAISPMMEMLLVFCNRGRDKIKRLYWERNGFVVWHKRLEKQRLNGLASANQAMHYAMTAT
ncbi:MAG: transposase [Zhongshania sp.]|jgi:transposase